MRYQIDQQGQGIAAQVPGAAPGASPVSAPPTSGGAFQAVRGFFEANRASADDTAQRALGGVEEQAQEAVDLAQESEEIPENFGGIETASEATAARDEALEKINAAGTQSGIEALLSQGKDATYTPGQRAADAAIAGRSDIMRDVQEKWGGTLGALQPTYAPSLERPVEPVRAPREITQEELTDLVTSQGLSPAQAYAEWKKQQDAEWNKQKEDYEKALAEYEKWEKRYEERKGDKKDGE